MLRLKKKLVLYHSPNVPEYPKTFGPAFAKSILSSRWQTYRASGEKLIRPLLRRRAPESIFPTPTSLSGFQTWPPKSMGMLSPYPSPEREKVLAALKDLDGYWTGVDGNLEVLAYNTKMVSGSDTPRTWEDLLAPRWKGQIGLEEEDVDWYTAILQLMGEEKGKDFMRGLAAQRPQIRTGHTLLAQLIGACDFARAPTIGIHQAETMRLKRRAHRWTAIEPLAPNPPISISIPKNAVHPNMARLFTNFVLSREGQMIVYQLNRNPSRTDVPQPVSLGRRKFA